METKIERKELIKIIVKYSLLGIIAIAILDFAIILLTQHTSINIIFLMFFYVFIGIAGGRFIGKLCSAEIKRKRNQTK